MLNKIKSRNTIDKIKVTFGRTNSLLNYCTLFKYSLHISSIYFFKGVFGFIPGEN